MGLRGQGPTMEKMVAGQRRQMPEGPSVDGNFGGELGLGIDTLTRTGLLNSALLTF